MGTFPGRGSNGKQHNLRSRKCDKYYILRCDHHGLMDTMLAIEPAMWAEYFNPLTPNIKERILLHCAIRF